MEALATYEASKDLERDDPAYWSKDRLNKINTGTDLEKRMATTDWDWTWYSAALREGKKITLSIAKMKNEFDRMMFDLFGNKYEDTGSYTISPDMKNFILLKTSYNNIKDYLRINLEFKKVSN